MKAFSIDAENNITVFASADSAPKTEGTEVFTSESALAELAAAWQGARLIEIWNTLPGMTPVKKFKDRATAVSRIWKAIQTLGDAAPAADQPEAVPATETAGESVAKPETATVITEAPATEVPAPAAPHAPDAAPEEAPANNGPARLPTRPQPPPTKSCCGSWHALSTDCRRNSRKRSGLFSRTRSPLGRRQTPRRSRIPARRATAAKSAR